MDEKPRRARTHADDDARANIGREHRRRTPVGGIPVEVDPEETPPPQPAPAPADRVADYGTIAPPIREALEIIANDLGNLTAAVGKVWDGRHDNEGLARCERLIERMGERLDKLAETVISTHTKLDGHIGPVVFAVRAQMDGLVTAHEQGRTRVEQFWETDWPRTVRTIDAIGPRIDRVERSQEMQGVKLEAMAVSISAMSDQFRGVAMLTSELEKRVIMLERDAADRRAGQHAASLVDVDVTARVAALEKISNDTALVKTADRRWIAKLVGFGSVLLGASAAGVKFLIDYLKGH